MNFPSRGWLELVDEEWCLYIPRSSRFQHLHNRNLPVAVGGRNKPVHLKLMMSNRPPFHNAFPVSLKQRNNGTIKLGPIIGILTVRDKNLYRGNRANFADIIRTGKSYGGVVYVFSPDDIDWNRQEVDGLHYLPKTKKWVKKKLPLPDVVYNRVPNRTYEQDPKVQATIRKLQQMPNIHLFNPKFFDKWELFEILKNSPMAKYLPDTAALRQKETLERMVQYYPVLYLKPIDGKAGDGIYRIEHEPPGYAIHYSESGKRISHEFQTVDDLWQMVRKLCNNRSYLVQEGIPLLTYQGSPFDVRVLVQKNLQGSWEVSGVGVRVAGSSGITTHVPQGGRIAEPKSALSPYFGESGSEEVLQKIRSAAIEIAQTLEDRFQLLGEMSMDIGVDRKKNIWFFEANAKPMKFDEPDIRKTSLRRIIEYSHYLASFKLAAGVGSHANS